MEEVASYESHLDVNVFRPINPSGCQRDVHFGYPFVYTSPLILVDFRIRRTSWKSAFLPTPGTGSHWHAPQMRLSDLQLKVQPEYHYGDKQCPWDRPEHIPADEELLFEIELIDYMDVKVSRSHESQRMPTIKAGSWLVLVRI